MKTIHELITEVEKDPVKKALLDKARAKFGKEDIEITVTDITDWILDNIEREDNSNE